MYLALGGLHSAETGPPEMLMELAYRLVTEDSPLIDKIRDNVIVGINPATDPDGRDRYTDWYYRNKIDDTDDLNAVPGAPYWGKYIFHDNNRDINYTGLSARNLLNFYLQWHPPIMHDLHESVPFLYTFSGQAPQNPSLDPILYGELPWFANFEMAQLTELRHARRLDPRLRGRVVAGLRGLHVVQPQRHLRDVRDLRQRRRDHRCCAMSSRSRRTGGGPTAAATRPSATGSGRSRPTRTSNGRCATTPTTWRPACSPACSWRRRSRRSILENFYTKSRNSIEAGRKRSAVRLRHPRRISRT